MMKSALIAMAFILCGSSVNIQRISETDLYWMQRCVEAEEHGNSYRAKYLTACCILNRVERGWGDSVEEVIFSPHQFEVVANRRIFELDPTEDTIRACNDALRNREKWVIAFSMGDQHSSWCDLVEAVDGEYYYKEKRK